MNPSKIHININLRFHHIGIFILQNILHILNKSKKINLFILKTSAKIQATKTVQMKKQNK